MHLSDDQLIEKTVESQSHLQQCGICQQKLTELNSFRQQLKELPQTKAPQDFWQQIKHHHYNKLEQKQAIKAKRKIQFWRNSSLALAASLVVALFVQIGFSNFSQQDSLQQNTQIALLIEQNRLLQQQLTAGVLHADFSETSVVKLQQNLLEIDRLLQQAYELNLPVQDKENLWKQRQELIKSSITNTKKPKIHRI